MFNFFYKFPPYFELLNVKKVAHLCLTKHNPLETNAVLTEALRHGPILYLIKHQTIKTSWS